MEYDTLSSMTRKEKGGTNLRPIAWARFWSKVKMPPIAFQPRIPVKEMTSYERRKKRCWIWQGRKYRGYGQFQLNGACWYAHRIAWMMFHGEMPEASNLVCHHCDNPSCVNPFHLFLGTSSDNQRDAAIKGRKHQKITPDTVREIRRICVPNDPAFGYSALARKYKCNPGSIWMIYNRKRWQHIE